MLWRTYFFYNDREILKECWPAVKKLIQYFENLRDASGLVKKHPAWHIADWPEFYATMDSSGQYLMVENSLYYQGLVLSARMAEALGEGALAGQYRQAAAGLKQAINRTFYDAEAHAYRDCDGSRKHHAGASVLALQFGIVPAAERDAVMAYVKSQGFSTSVVLTYNLIEMLYDSDQAEFAYSLIARTDWPGWGYMVKKGSGTTWESWYNLVSLSHPFTSYWARFMISGIVGLKPAAPGWKVIAVRPHPAGDLKWAKAKLQTAAGPVEASWEKTEEGFSLSVTIPGNTEAKVSLPLPGDCQRPLRSWLSLGRRDSGTVTPSSGVDCPRRSAFEIYEGENLIWPQEGAEPDPALKFAGQDQGFISFIAGSGQWKFNLRVSDLTP
jgi:alpha-L-rhamnosidase